MISSSIQLTSKESQPPPRRKPLTHKHILCWPRWERKGCRYWGDSYFRIKGEGWEETIKLTSDLDVGGCVNRGENLIKCGKQWLFFSGQRVAMISLPRYYTWANIIQRWLELGPHCQYGNADLTLTSKATKSNWVGGSSLPVVLSIPSLSCRVAGMESCWALLKTWPSHSCQSFLTRPKPRKDIRWHQCWGGWPRTSARWNAVANIAQGENMSINSIGWSPGHQM